MTSRSIFACVAQSSDYFDPETQICWHIGSGHGRHRCQDRHEGQKHFGYGRCRSGKRWFWVIHTYTIGSGESAYEQGTTETEEEAAGAVIATIVRLACGEPVMAYVSHNHARWRLKELNEAKQRARPPSDATDTKVVEYLYGYDGHPVRFRITKKTSKRVFYRRSQQQIDQHDEPVEDFGRLHEDEVGYVDRQKLEADDEIRSRRYWSADYHLFTSFEGMWNYNRGRVAARERYLTARKRADLP